MADNDDDKQQPDEPEIAEIGSEPIPEQTLNSNQEVNIDFSQYFIADKNDDVAYHLEHFPEGLTMDATTGVVTGTAPKVMIDTPYLASITATSNKTGDEISEFFPILVVPVMEPKGEAEDETKAAESEATKEAPAKAATEGDLDVLALLGVSETEGGAVADAGEPAEAASAEQKAAEEKSAREKLESVRIGIDIANIYEATSVFDPGRRWELLRIIQYIINQHYATIYLYDGEHPPHDFGDLVAHRQANSGFMIYEFDNILAMAPGESAFAEYGNRKRFLATVEEMYTNDLPKRSWQTVGISGSDNESIGKAWVMARLLDLPVSEEAPTDEAFFNFRNLRKLIGEYGAPGKRLIRI